MAFRIKQLATLAKLCNPQATVLRQPLSGVVASNAVCRWERPQAQRRDLITRKPKYLPKKDKEETQTYAAGTAVWLHSLVAEAQYNGQRALVIPGSSDGRIAVVVAPGEVSAGKKLRVRARNLVLE
eukprot:gene19724-8207_t